MESLAAMTVADYGKKLESLDDATDSGVLNTTVEQVAQEMFPNHGKLIVIYHLSHGGIFPCSVSSCMPTYHICSNSNRGLSVATNRGQLYLSTAFINFGGYCAVPSIKQY